MKLFGSGIALMAALRVGSIPIPVGFEAMSYERRQRVVTVALQFGRIAAPVESTDAGLLPPTGAFGWPIA